MIGLEEAVTDGALVPLAGFVRDVGGVVGMLVKNPMVGFAEERDAVDGASKSDTGCFDGSCDDDGVVVGDALGAKDNETLDNTYNS